MKNFINTKNIIKKYYKKNTVILNLLFVVQSLLELTTIFVILLLIRQILNVESNIFSRFGIILNRSESVAYLSIFTLFFLILSFIFNLVINKKIIKFGYEIYIDVVNKTFNNLLNTTYTNINSLSFSFISTRLLNETRRVCEYIIIPYYLVISKFIILILITIGLVIYKPLISLSAITFISLVFIIFYYLTRLRNVAFGIQISSLEKKILSILNNVFYGFKDLKLNNLKTNFYKDFKNNQKNLANILMHIKFTHLSARYVLELVVFSVFILIIIFLNYENKINEVVLSTMAFYLFVVLKMLPHINVVYLNYSLWKTHYQSLENVENLNKKLLESVDHQYIKESYEKTLSEIKEITFKKFNFEYSDSKPIITLVNNIYLKKKTIVGLKGASGSGKTTLLDILTGIINLNIKNNGGVYINGNSLNKIDISEYYKKLSYVQQRVFLLHDTIKKNIILDKDYDEDLFQRVLELSCCSEFLSQNNRVEEIISFGRENLSGGQIQRIGIARALYKLPEIIILDEATNALDKDTQNIILKNILELDCVNFAFISAHNDKILENCDVVIEIKNGEINIL
jgi:ABC-type bacteriocin/lantibiotic exporter with double-glycine peptidase domain